jgi:hypothetical protein
MGINSTCLTWELCDAKARFARGLRPDILKILELFYTLVLEQGITFRTRHMYSHPPPILTISHQPHIRLAALLRQKLLKRLILNHHAPHGSQLLPPFLLLLQ